MAPTAKTRDAAPDPVTVSIASCVGATRRLPSRTVDLATLLRELGNRLVGRPRGSHAAAHAPVMPEQREMSKSARAEISLGMTVHRLRPTNQIIHRSLRHLASQRNSRTISQRCISSTTGCSNKTNLTPQVPLSCQPAAKYLSSLALHLPSLINLSKLSCSAPLSGR